MKCIKVKEIVIGEGSPKICVPITGRSKNEILEEARSIAGMPGTADIAEWRIDMFEGVFDSAALSEIFSELRAALGEIPLIVTLRSSREGGELDIDAEKYTDICVRIASERLADILDVELFTGCNTECFQDLSSGICFNAAAKIIAAAHEAGIRVIASNHDFEGTPDKDEIICRLQAMQDIGADITKIAVMPQIARDVLTLLDASLEMREKYADRPFVAISMGHMGTVSRISGELFGSAITFGAAGSAITAGNDDSAGAADPGTAVTKASTPGTDDTAAKASAPGQISAAELKNILELLHQ